LYPFFDLQKVCIKAVKANSPWIVRLSLEHVQYGKALVLLGHRWELQPRVLNRKQFQEVSAFFPGQYRTQHTQIVVGQTIAVIDVWQDGSLSAKSGLISQGNRQKMIDRKLLEKTALSLRFLSPMTAQDDRARSGRTGTPLEIDG
jgi:hypothetical protein